jgi:hypothetical protein
VSSRLAAPLELAAAWAGSPLALLVGGSHATGSGVWVAVEGRELSLSDLDVYAVVRDRAARREGEARARADRPGLRARLLAWGLAAPLEVAFLEPADLARLPARPATLELARQGLVVAGDPAWRDRVPRWEPREVSGEEILLLLENRAFELLLAWPALEAREPLARLQARHAVLKSALDLVRVEALRAGEYPGDAKALAAWAARQGRVSAPGGGPSAFLALLDTAVAWRSGRAAELDPPPGGRAPGPRTGTPSAAPGAPGCGGACAARSPGPHAAGWARPWLRDSTTRCRARPSTGSTPRRPCSCWLLRKTAERARCRRCPPGRSRRWPRSEWSRRGRAGTGPPPRAP